MKKQVLSLLTILALTGCQGFDAVVGKTPSPTVDTRTYFPVASATINVSSYGELARLMNQKRPGLMSLLLPYAVAQVSQGSATVNVTYTNPGVKVFTVNTSALGNAVTVSGDDLNLGEITISGLDDNSLRVCTNNPPQNRCNRAYIRVFTLGTASGGVVDTAGFINVGGQYGIPVFAGSVPTALGFNSSPTAGTVTDAATVFTHSWTGNSTNRLRLQNLSIPSIPIKANLSNAGSGDYEMNLVVQYALGYE